MVLRNASSHPMVDCRNGSDLGAGTMPYRDAIPAILQLPLCLCQITILATPHYIPLFRPSKPRPTIPRLLSPTILPTSGGILRPLTRPLRMASFLRYYIVARHLAFPVNTIPRQRAVLKFGLYLGAAQPRYSS